MFPYRRKFQQNTKNAKIKNKIIDSIANAIQKHETEIEKPSTPTNEAIDHIAQPLPTPYTDATRNVRDVASYAEHKQIV